MRSTTRLLMALGTMAALAGGAHAQPKAPPSQLKIQVLLTEFEGERKVASLPYVFTTVMDEDQHGMSQASLRLGISVPLLVQTKEGNTQTQYQDVGTNIDCRAKRYEDGRFKLTFAVERSSVYEPGSTGEKGMPAESGKASTPVLRRYSSSFDMLLGDGQSAQGP